MSTGQAIQRVRMYMSEDDRWAHQPLYIAVLEILRREGATGATVLHGIAGFGPGQGIRPAGMGKAGSHNPVVIEWVDHAERIQHVLPLLDELLPESLITTEPVTIYRAVLRSHGAFGDALTVKDIMQPSPQVATQASRMKDAISLMIAGKQAVLPVLDDSRKIVGIMTEQTIARRAGLLVPLYLIRLLTADEGKELLSPIANLSCTDTMNKEWRTVHSGAFVPQALLIMLEWGYEQIPVIDRDGTFVGLLSQSDVLAAVMHRSSDDESNIREAEESTPVSLVMQQNVPQVNVSQPLGVAIQSLLKSPDRYVVVIDEERTVVGSISDIQVFRRLDPTERAPILAAMQQATPLDIASLPGADRSLDMLIERDITTVTPKRGITDAIRLLMQHQIERAPVVDDDGKLLGLIARGGLVRALVQETTR